MKAKISEIFKSIQGEGVYQGQEQVFVRFYGCNLACSFCDTHLNSYTEKTVEEVINEIINLGECHSVSLTGGEPLLQQDFLNALAAGLKARGLRVYLETNGVLAENLRRVIDNLDIVSMDFKMPTSTGLKSYWAQHREFLKAASGKDVFVKAVVGRDTQLCDIRTAMAIIREVRPQTKFVLQPQNPFEDILTAKVKGYVRTCRESGIEAEIGVQMHKQWGVK